METYANDRAECAPVEQRPLEEISSLVDDLSRMNEALSAYVTRFNGPMPSPILTGNAGAATLAAPPTCYRSEINRLRRTISDTGVLVDNIVKFG